MQRVTVTLDDALMAELDRLVAARGYQNRSEAIRDLARAGLQQTATGAAADRHCVAALVYAYDHGVRELAKRLTHAFHDHHDIAVSTLHVHLDHESCMEVAVLKGPAAAVHEFADSVIAERGVRHGRLVVVPVELSSERHKHGEQASHSHEHAHLR
ncbi:MAG: nickel-responsive transcriptional regulator NikR [Acidisphaera sp.]|nr:nickel-responsive transcriptional regulator NikR [Acidisphaera sp.]